MAREIALEDLPQHITEEHNPGNTRHVGVADIQLPSDLLRYGFLFIDTPGLGSGITANTEATRRFLDQGTMLMDGKPEEVMDFSLQLCSSL